MLQHVLKEADIPYIAFKYAENSGQMQPIREQAGTFCRLDQAMERNMTTNRHPEGRASAADREGRLHGEAERDDGRPLRAADETRPRRGEKVASTFVPGNLNELIMCFDLVNNLPEVNAIQSGLRRQSGGYVLEAEKIGHSEDVCTYVKSDIGMMAKGNIGPNGKKLPDPDVLASVLYRLLHVHEVVRAPARAVQMRDDHAAHALYG